MATSQGDMQAKSVDSTSTPWPELLGKDDWAGLLDPLDMSLRRLILLCGDLCQVTYDSFNADKHSAYCGSCRYGMNNLLRMTLFPAADDMTVAAYLYATSETNLPGGLMLYSLSREPWSKESNWIGYVAVSSDAAAAATGRRVIYIAWRGTIRTLEWVDVLKPKLVGIEKMLSTEISTTTTTTTDGTSEEDDEDKHRPKVMKGWYTIYTSSDSKSPFTKFSAREQLMAAVKQLVDKYKGEDVSILCAGHSLGASLATLTAFDIVENGLSKVGDRHIPVTAIVFGSPQIGNQAFKERFDALPNLHVLRVKNRLDVIPLYPSGLLGYASVGVELEIDSRKSPVLKTNTTNVGDYHNLQAMLHTVAGWNGPKGEFALRVERSIALVNKSSAFLKDECLVPESWWVEKNNGMVLGADGQWQLAAPPGEDLPVPPFMDPVKLAAAGLVSDGEGENHVVIKPAEADGKDSRRRPSLGFCCIAEGQVVE